MDSGPGGGRWETLWHHCPQLTPCSKFGLDSLQPEVHETSRLPAVETVRKMKNYMLNDKFMWENSCGVLP